MAISSKYHYILARVYCVWGCFAKIKKVSPPAGPASWPKITAGLCSSRQDQSTLRTDLRALEPQDSDPATADKRKSGCGLEPRLNAMVMRKITDAVEKDLAKRIKAGKRKPAKKENRAG
jgi:hypothetical protein